MFDVAINNYHRVPEITDGRRDPQLGPGELVAPPAYRSAVVNREVKLRPTEFPKTAVGRVVEAFGADVQLM
jgi:hypothetical protein